MQVDMSNYPEVPLPIHILRSSSLGNTTQASPADPDGRPVRGSVLYDASEDSRSTPSSDGKMDPGRAHLLLTAPIENDPNRDLYEAPPPGLAKKTGSNDIPLGSRFSGRSGLKRKQELSLREQIAKRQQTESLRLSSMGRDALSDDFWMKPKQNSLQQERADSPSLYAEPPVIHAVPMSFVVEGAFPLYSDTILNSVKSAQAAGLEMPVRTLNMDNLPMIKIEDARDSLDGRENTPPLVTRLDNLRYSPVFIGGYPLALWTGSRNPKRAKANGYITGRRIPLCLGDHLAHELTHYIRKAGFEHFRAMPPNGDMCIVQYLSQG